jgi:hypothetical protein
MNRKRLLFLLVSLSLAASTFAAPPPEITRISPNTGPPQGNTTVTITGQGFELPPNFACFIACPPKVSFGTTQVVPSTYNDTTIVVTTPPHPPGPVIVTVTTGDNRSTSIVDGFTYTDTPIPTEPSYETVLLPIYLDAPVSGGNGSLWSTDLWIRNDGPFDAGLAPWPCPADGVCAGIFPNTLRLAPGDTLHGLRPFFIRPPSIPGRLVYLERNVARVSMQLRIADTAHAQHDSGTELPVVREGGQLSLTAQLLNVPLSAANRLLLRVYDVALTEARFHVRVYGLEEGNKSGELLTEFDLTATTPETGQFRTQPAYAEYSRLTDLLAQPRIFPAAIRVQVQPLTPGSRFWTFVAVTNNDTQHVTTVTPQ